MDGDHYRKPQPTEMQSYGAQSHTATPAPKAWITSETRAVRARGTDL